MRKKFFMFRLTQHWNRQFREATEYSRLKRFQTLLDVFLCHALWVTLPWQESAQETEI